MNFEQLIQNENKDINLLFEELAEMYPQLQKVLGRRTFDIDVQMLLFAITMKNAELIKQNEQSSIIMSERFLRFLYPDLLNPTPPLAMVHFEAKPNCQCSFTLPAKSLLETNQLPCQLVQQTSIHPLSVIDAQVSIKDNAQLLSITLQKTQTDASLEALKDQPLVIYLNMPEDDQLNWRYYLSHCTENVTLIIGNQRIKLGHGLKKQQSALKHNLLANYQHCHNPFGGIKSALHFPSVFAFFELCTLPTEALKEHPTFHIELSFTHEKVAPSRPDKDHFLINVGIVAQLESVDAKPMMLDHTQYQHDIRLEDKGLSIHQVTKVQAFNHQEHQQYELLPEGLNVESEALAYQLFRGFSIGKRHPLYLHTDSLAKFAPTPISLSIDCLAFNANKSAEIQPNTPICFNHANPCNKVSAKTLIYFTEPLFAPEDKLITWRLVQQLSSTFVNLESEDVLKEVMSDQAFEKESSKMQIRHFFSAIANRKSDDIDSFKDGCLLRSRRTLFRLRSSLAMSTARLDLLGDCISYLFKEYTPVNYPHLLEMRLLREDLTLKWD